MSKTNVASLLEAREAARTEASASPLTSRIEELRDQIAQGANRGKDVAEFVAHRNEMKDQRDAKVVELGAKISQLRRAEKAALVRAEAAELERHTTEELEAMRHALTEERRAVKRKQRAVVAALSKRATVDMVRDLYGKLSPEQREELKAQFAASTKSAG